VLVGWPVTIERQRPEAPVDIFTRNIGRDYEVTDLARDISVMEPSVTSAVSTIIVEMVNDYVMATNGYGSLHSAAVEIGGRLVVFPAGTRAGKSTLATAFTAAGYRVFSDDILPIDFSTGEAVATGCLPRIRLPMPDKAPAWFREHISAHTVATDGYYVYTGSRPDARVAFGDRCLLGAIVLLERSETPVEAHLSPAQMDDGLLRVLTQDTRSTFAVDEAFDHYLQLIGTLDVYRFVYCDLDDAIACLDAAFESWPERKDGADDLTSDRVEARVHHGQIVGQGPVYQRAQEVWLRTVDGSGFLVDPVHNRIHHMNAVGTGLWHLLSEPADLQGAVTVFAEAFPDTDRLQLAADIAGVIGEMENLGLIERIDAAGSRSIGQEPASGDRPAALG
jgi:hypothetical protein